MFSEDDFERNFIISLATGPNWFQFFLPIFNLGFLPNLMWFKNLRRTIYTSFVIVTWWHLSFYLIRYLTIRKMSHPSHDSHTDFLTAEYFEKGFIFSVLLLIIYLILNRKNKLFIRKR